VVCREGLASPLVLGRLLDESYSPEVRQRITLLTTARSCANACFRFAPPFLATIASGLGVSLSRMGVAVAITELSGLLSPLTNRLGERLHRRTAMTTGLLLVAAASAGVAASRNMWIFTLCLVVLAQSKVLFDLGLGAWFSDRVPYEQRGRVFGINEMSWAFGLLLGVTALGLVTAAAGWRVAYLVGMVSVIAIAGAVRWKVPADHNDTIHARRVTTKERMPRRALLVFFGMFCLMGAAQMLFVTFGSWLKDHFGMTDAGVSAVVFGLGFCELLASSASARYADAWGKERATALGAALIIPAALLLAVGHGHLWIGLPALIIAIGAFEFAVVSVVPLTTELVPSAPSRGIASSFAMGTLGRATASIPATVAYTRWGMAVPACMAAVLATGTVFTMTHHHRVHRPLLAAA
jgi:predicted MFS family arabinose efflux permease